MITLKEIHPNIQRTLIQKMRMLEKREPFSQIGEPTTEEGGEPQSNYMFSRSVMTRMVSLLARNNKPVVITGGELKGGKFQHGFEDLYGKRGPGDDNLNHRPISGIQEVNIEYLGGGMKIGATRKTTINWTCWSWEELQRLKPFFLKHGRTVLIEFGWSFKGVDAPLFLDILDDNGEFKNQTLKKDSTGQSLQERLPEHILKQKGHYDAVLGTIMNFEFSVNDTGGFDCTTELVSMGVNTFHKADDKENLKGNLHRLPINSPKEGFWWWQDPIYGDELQSKEPYYNFNAYMKSFQSHLHLNVKNSKGSIAYLGNFKTLKEAQTNVSWGVSTHPYCTWGWFEDNVLSRFVGMANEKNEVVTEFRSIESVYDEQGNVKEGEEGIQNVRVRTSNDILTPDFGKWFFVKNEEGFISNVDFTQRTAGNVRKGDYKVAASYTPSFYGDASNLITQAQWIAAFGDLPAGGRNYNSNSTPWTEDSHFRIFAKENESHGEIRNIYFHHKFLTDCFTDTSTLKDGIMKVWDIFSAEYGGIYDFAIDFDDKEGRLLVRDRGFTNKRIHTILENKSIDENYDLENPGVFVFPIWEKDSFVVGQTLSAKLPQRMQTAAMYGSNQTDIGLKDDGMIDNLEDWGATSLGRSEAKVEKETLAVFSTESSEEAKEQKLYDFIVGSMTHPFRRNKDGKSVTFGNASATEHLPLKWSDSNANNTTGVWEDKSPDTNLDGAKVYIKSELQAGSGEDTRKAEKNSLGMPFLGINEVMEIQVHEEFQSRLRKQMGYGDDHDKRLTTDKVSKSRMEWDTRGYAQDFSKFYTSSSPNLDGINHTLMGGEYKSLMQSTLKQNIDGLLKQTDPMIPIELELEIDGTGGIFPGNSFHSSYLPKTYMDKVIFQVITASHKISPTGWITTIKGQMRVSGYTKAEGDEAKRLRGEAVKETKKKMDAIQKEPNSTAKGMTTEVLSNEIMTAEKYNLLSEEDKSSALILDTNNDPSDGIKFETEVTIDATDATATDQSGMKNQLSEQTYYGSELEKRDKLLFDKAEAIERDTSNVLGIGMGVGHWGSSHWSYTELKAVAAEFDNNNGSTGEAGMAFLDWFYVESTADRIETGLFTSSQTETENALQRFISEGHANQFTSGN